MAEGATEAGAAIDTDGAGGGEPADDEDEDAEQATKATMSTTAALPRAPKLAIANCMFRPLRPVLAASRDPVKGRTARLAWTRGGHHSFRVGMVDIYPADGRLYEWD
jgi:hypothetical protein